MGGEGKGREGNGWGREGRVGEGTGERGGEGREGEGEDRGGEERGGERNAPPVSEILKTPLCTGVYRINFKKDHYQQNSVFLFLLLFVINNVWAT